LRTIAAARQKEMNVSITEDATISRTRSDGGATVVREEAIVKVPARRPANYIPWGAITRRPALSVCLNRSRVNRNKLLCRSR
jgi:hypothetical protein